MQRRRSFSWPETPWLISMSRPHWTVESCQSFEVRERDRESCPCYSGLSAQWLVVLARCDVRDPESISRVMRCPSKCDAVRRLVVRRLENHILSPSSTNPISRRDLRVADAQFLAFFEMSHHRIGGGIGRERTTNVTRREHLWPSCAKAVECQFLESEGPICQQLNLDRVPRWLLEVFFCQRWKRRFFSRRDGREALESVAPQIPRRQSLALRVIKRHGNKGKGLVAAIRRLSLSLSTSRSTPSSKTSM